MAINWTPFTLSWDDNVPVDLSFVFQHEKPAGKHGFLGSFGDRFVFEDGTEGRFWGTNFNSGANFPSHSSSEMIARRLGKFGVNVMRTHQMDAEWSTPNIFTSNRARPKDNTRSLDPECMDRLDYLIHCLKNEGVYIYLDLLTYRQFLPGDAVEAYEQLPQAAKPYMYFDRRLIELQKEFNEQLWCHVNPFTGLAYKDEPAIILTELVNEADLFTHRLVVEPYRARFEVLYRQWLNANGLKLPADAVDFTQHTPEMGRFFVAVMRGYNEEMAAHLRKIGVKIPITGTNWSTRLGVAAAQDEMDFTDSHVYWNYPWSDPVGTIVRKPMVASAENDYASLTMMRDIDRPFFVSEWDHAYPAEYRAESSPLLAAVSAFQGWGGCTIHTYRYSTWEPENRLAGGSSTINGVVYRNFFDSFNDPAKFGLFYQSALLLRRGDVQPGNEMVALRVDEDPGWELRGVGDLAGLNGIPEWHRVGVALPGVVTGADRELSAVEPSLERANGEVLSDTGQLYRSWNKRFGWIDTPRSKVAYGFLGEQAKINLRGLELEVVTDYAVVALGSLTDDDLGNSSSILVTAVGRCQNSHVRFSDDGSRMLHPGEHPMMIEPIEATIHLHTNRPALKVFVISEHGELVCRLPVTYQEGVLHFQIGRQPEYYPSTMYYLIRS